MIHSQLAVRTTIACCSTRASILARAARSNRWGQQTCVEYSAVTLPAVHWCGVVANICKDVADGPGCPLYKVTREKRSQCARGWACNRSQSTRSHHVVTMTQYDIVRCHARSCSALPVVPSLWWAMASGPVGSFRGQTGQLLFFQCCAAVTTLCHFCAIPCAASEHVAHTIAVYDATCLL